MTTDIPTDIPDACATLSRAGNAWRDHLPDGATITYDADPVMRDQVALADGTRLYHAPEAWGDQQWFPMGWSDASQARAYRPVPIDPDGPARFAALGSDEGDPHLGWMQRCDATLDSTGAACGTPWGPDRSCPNAAAHRHPGQDSLGAALDAL